MSAVGCEVWFMPSSTSAETHAHAPTERIAGRAAGIAVAVALIASFMDLLDATIVSVAAPAIAKDLGASASALQWTIAAYTLAIGAGMVTGGRVGDQLGRRRIFLIGLAAFALTSAAAALAPTAGFLIAVRVLQGLSAGLMVPQVFGIIRSSLDPATMGKAFGAYGAVQGLAAIAGPLLGGGLVDANLFGLGWRTIFWVNVPIAIVGLALGVKALPESTSENGARLDVLGAVLVSTAAVLILLPLVQGGDWGWPAWGYAMMALGAATAAAFLAWERRLVRSGGQPILDPSLLKVRAFSAGLAASALFFGAIGSFFFLLSLYLQLGTGRSAWQTGLVTLPYAIGSLVTSGVGVQLAPKAGRAVLVAGSLTLALSQAIMWWMVRDGADPGYWSLAVPLFVGGLGLGLAAPSLVNVILAGVPGRNAGAAGGVLTTINQIGNSTGVAILGTLFFTTLTAAASRPPAALRGYSDAFSSILPWQAGLYVIAAGLMLALPKKAAGHPQ